MRIVTRAECGRERWNEIVHASPDGWLWATWEWQEIVGAVPRWQLEDRGFGIERDGRLAAVVPLHWSPVDRRLSGSGFGLTSPAIRDGFSVGERQALLTHAFAHARSLANQLGAKRLEFAVNPVTPTALQSVFGVNPLVHFGFADESGHARVLDLRQDEEAVWRGFSRDARQQIRKATNAGYRAATVEWRTYLDDYYRLHCETYTRTGVPPHPREYFAGIAEVLGPLGHSVLTAAFAPDGRVVAFHNTARLGARAMYHTGCSADEALRGGVNYLVFSAALQSARAGGCEWYELGEVFPGHASGKTAGLSTFKSKFGGEIRRSFRGAIQLDAATAPEPVAAAEPTSDVEPATPDQTIRDAYQTGTLYQTSRICLKPDAGSDDYVDRLLHEKLQSIADYYRGGRIVDLCCASGIHLMEIARGARSAIGIDFSERYLEEGQREARARKLQNVSFVRADARRLPLSSGSVDFLYCFSALYAIPRPEEAVSEVGRVLAPGGTAVLDFGNRRSLNVFCLRYYTEWPPISPLTLSQIHASLKRAGLSIVRHRRFQVLPLWAGRPRWLSPLLHPAWKRVFRTRINGRMLDEWVSSLPGLRAIAFRHLIVCQRPA